MLSQIRHIAGHHFSDPVARIIAKTRLTPNVLTIAGFLINIGVAALLAWGHLFIGGFLVLLSGVFDLLDGALARVTGQSTKFGAILDSTFDRFSEAIVLFGLLFFYTHPPLTREILLIFTAMVGSVLVSYVRARAEGLGLRCEVGLFTRPERIILLAVGLIFSQTLTYILWILAAGTNLAVLWRLLYLWRQTRKLEGGSTRDRQEDGNPV